MAGRHEAPHVLEFSWNRHATVFVVSALLALVPLVGLTYLVDPVFVFVGVPLIPVGVYIGIAAARHTPEVHGFWAGAIGGFGFAVGTLVAIWSVASPS